MIETQSLQQSQTNQFISQALSEVLGVQSPVDSHADFASEPFQEIWAGLHSRFGDLGCSGTAFRVGQAMFKYGLQDFGHISGSSGVEFRLSPTRTKLWLSLQMVEEIIETFPGHEVELFDEGDHFSIQIFGRSTDCLYGARLAMDQIMRGMTQAALDWASGGKYYQVAQKCADDEKSCTLKIDSSPI